MSMMSLRTHSKTCSNACSGLGAHPHRKVLEIYLSGVKSGTNLDHKNLIVRIIM